MSVKPWKRKIRMIIVGVRITPEEAAKRIRESETHEIAGEKLMRTAAEVRFLAWRLREAGFDCGDFRPSGFKKKAVINEETA